MESGRKRHGSRGRCISNHERGREGGTVSKAGSVEEPSAAHLPNERAPQRPCS